jgi:hypothetical protein
MLPSVRPAGEAEVRLTLESGGVVDRRSQGTAFFAYATNCVILLIMQSFSTSKPAEPSAKRRRRLTHHDRPNGQTL